MTRKQTGSCSTIEVARVLSLVTGFILAGYGGAFIAGIDVAHAAGTGGTGAGGTGTGGTGTGGTGTGGTGAGTGGTGTGGSTGSGTGTGGIGIGSGTGTGGTGGAGAGVGIGAAGSGSGTGFAGGGISAGTGEGRAESSRGFADQRGAPSWVTRSTGFASAPPHMAPAVGPPLSLIVAPPANAPTIGKPDSVSSAVVPALARETQAFRFDVGTAVFPTTGGMFTTEGVDGVDVVTVDARHHRIIRPAAFFEPHEGAQYDRRAVERFWPIELGKQVRFVETAGNDRWLHVMGAVRVETVSVPAGLFRSFVVERTVQSLEQGARPAATYTYWYAPEAGAIVKTQLQPGDGRPTITEEADVLGYPLSRLSTASTRALP